MVSGLLGCHCLPVANIDDALTSLTFGWVLTAAGLIYSYFTHRYRTSKHLESSSFSFMLETHLEIKFAH